MKLIKTKEIKTTVEIYQVHENIHLDKTTITRRGRSSMQYELFYKDDFSGMNFRPFYVDRKEFDRERQKSTYMEIMDNKKLFKKVSEKTEIDVNNIILLSWDSHTFWDVDENPLSCVYQVNYIGSLQEHPRYRDEKFDKLINKIKEHPYILKLNIDEIAYYNRDFEGQRGISYCEVFIPDKEYKRLWNVVKDDKFPSVRLKDVIQFQTIKGIDLYGLNKELKEYWRDRWKD